MGTVSRANNRENEMQTEWTTDDSAILLIVSCRMGLRLSDVCNLGNADRADSAVMAIAQENKTARTFINMNNGRRADVRGA